MSSFPGGILFKDILVANLTWHKTHAENTFEIVLHDISLLNFLSSEITDTDLFCLKISQNQKMPRYCNGYKDN